jgi:hypothetical protein
MIRKYNLADPFDELQSGGKSNCENGPPKFSEQAE